MKYIIIQLSIVLILFSCGLSSSRYPENENKTTFKVETYVYDSLSIPMFFERLVNNHMKEFILIDSSEYIDLCSSNALDPHDTSNIKQFYTIKINHAIFTSKNASNGSRGEILNLPYLWHWVKPNPRYEISLVENKQKLKDIKPPKEFSKYNSFADIDRTPFLFLSELFLENPKYYSERFDTFATFGWCSEREMAFVCLMELLNYRGKVIAENNHSWSEFIIFMDTKSNGSKNFRVKVDNTFDKIEWEEIETVELGDWRKDEGNSGMARWYNQKALSDIEKVKIEHFKPSPHAMARIEDNLVKYLDKTLNKP